MLKKKLGINAIERDWSNDFGSLKNYFKVSTLIIIPEGCVEIGCCAFWNCNKVREVVIPESVEVIRLKAFSYCWDLKKVSIPKSVREIGRLAFERCSMLEEVVIPESVENINACAFEGCYKATIILKKPESEFKYIGSRAFDDCKDVKEETRN